MAFTPVDINAIQLDKPKQTFSGFKPIDINAIQLDQAQPPQPSKDFIKRFGEDLSSRVTEGKKIEKAYKSGEIGFPRATYQYAGKVGAGTVLDLVQEGTVSAFRALPDFVETPIREAAGATLDNPIGQLGLKALKSGGEMWQGFRQENPNVARDVESTMNLLGLYSLISPREAAKAGTKAVKGTGKIVAKPAIQAKAGAKKLAEGLSARTAEELDDALIGLKQQVSPLFEQSRELGAIINKNKAKNILVKTKKSLGVDLTKKSSQSLYGDIISVLDDMAEDVAKTNFGVNDLHDYRKLLGEVKVKNAVSNPAVADKVGDVIDVIDNSLVNLKPINIVGGNTDAVELLMRGIKGWKNVKKFETIADLIKSAGGNPDKIRSLSARLANNKKKFSILSQQEKAIIRAMANPGKADQIMKGLGRFGLEPDNVFLPIVGGGLGAAVGSGGTAGALVAAGTLSRQARKYATRAEPERLLKIIEKGINNAINEKR